MLEELPAKREIWKLLDLLNWTSQYLADKGFENPRLNVEQLLAHTLGCDRIGLYLNADKPIVPDELTTFKSLLKRRLKNEPIQYILGKTEFMSLPLNVTPAALIPRPETEILVETVIHEINSRFQELKTITCLDIGTGSGNIAIALARYLPKIRVNAIDIRTDSLALAHQNAKLNNVSDQIRFELCDFQNPDFGRRFENLFNVVAANPPYIATGELQLLPPEIRNYEPGIALDGGPDGLRFYRKIANDLNMLLASGGFAAFEIGYQQAKSIQSLFLSHGYPKVRIKQDLAGKDRVVIVTAEK